MGADLWCNRRCQAPLLRRPGKKFSLRRNAPKHAVGAPEHATVRQRSPAPFLALLRGFARSPILSSGSAPVASRWIEDHANPRENCPPPHRPGSYRAFPLHGVSQDRGGQGKAGGGLCYGYDVVKQLDARGEPVRGERTINAGEAAMVRRIFRDFANGLSPQAITRALNAEHIVGPGGKLWSATTLRGHVKRRHRPAEQRTLYRQTRVEPAALCQRPAHRQTRLTRCGFR